MNEGTFTGSEQGNGEIDELAGHFKDYDIEFTFTNGPEKDVKYTGKLIKDSDPLVMKVKGTNDVQLEIVQK